MAPNVLVRRRTGSLIFGGRIVICMAGSSSTIRMWAKFRASEAVEVDRLGRSIGYQLLRRFCPACKHFANGVGDSGQLDDGSVRTLYASFRAFGDLHECGRHGPPEPLGSSGARLSAKQGLGALQLADCLWEERSGFFDGN
jgi:hypothetical protein